MASHIPRVSTLTNTDRSLIRNSSRNYSYPRDRTDSVVHSQLPKPIPHTSEPTTTKKKRKFEALEDKDSESNVQKKTKVEHSDDQHSQEKGQLQTNLHGIKETRTVTRRNSASSIKEVKMHFLPMKGTIYMEKIISGEKKYEGRVCRAVVSKLRVEDHLQLSDNRAGWGIKCKITSLDKYTTFEAMLQAKGVLSLLPQLADKAKQLSDNDLLQEGVKVYEGFPGAEGVHSFGVMAIGVEYLERIQLKRQSTN